jgi:D-inositol-3-phosphate glycosyltransferase
VKPSGLVLNLRSAVAHTRGSVRRAMSETLAPPSSQLSLGPRQPEIEVALLTGCQDRHYAFGLAMSLVSRGVRLDIIGSDEVDCAEMHATPRLKFFNLRGSQRRGATVARKVLRVLMYYARLVRYTTRAKPRIFHILWNNKFEFFDRTFLMLCYKLRGKKLVLTAHNVNAARRDSTDSPFNRFTLRVQYHLSDHIFVHTKKMKTELVETFGVRERAVTVIPYGINNAVPDTDLTADRARRRLGIKGGERTILFFGAIAPYKGLDLLVEAFQQIAAQNVDYRLIVAGMPKGGCEEYLAKIREEMSRIGEGRVVQKIEYIPDDEVELYFKAADVLVLPYRQIFQSGIFFLSYSFGLPVIAADVGSFREDILEGRTGFLCKPSDSADLALTIDKYFRSDLFMHLSNRRHEIRKYALARHSWEVVGEMTDAVYGELLRKWGPDPS